MNPFQGYGRQTRLLAALLLCSLAAACSRPDSILGAGGVVPPPPEPPTVTEVTPVPDEISVPVDDTVITATFSEPMAPISGAATFTVTCEAPCTSPTGTVTLDSTNTVATFAADTSLEPLTPYTATVTAARSLATDAALEEPFEWQFITEGTSPDAIRPRVSSTVPATTSPGPTLNAPTNAAIFAVFTEPMVEATIEEPATFTVTCALPCINPTGVVSYAPGSRTAVFTPDAAFAVSTTYTATITTAATDMAGNALAGNQAALPAASNYVWSFQTAAVAAPAGDLVVASTNPDAGATDVCPNDTVNATFTIPSGLRINPLTLNEDTFTVTGPLPTLTPVVASSIMVDAATGTIATFTPQDPLSDGVTYTANLVSGPTGVRDAAIPPNEMASDFSWQFTVGAGPNCPAPVASILGTAEPYGVFGGSAGMTNTGIQTAIAGDIGTIATGSSAITGFHDTGGDVYTETGANVGAVNGLIYTCTNSTTGPTTTTNIVSCAVATQARLDAEAAYNELRDLPPGANPGANLANLTLAPGVYTAPNGSFLIEGGDLTLDAQGDVDATWVFQMASTLTVGGPGAAAPQSIVLAGGAQAKNVFWQVGTAATINAAGGGTMVGTIIAQDGIAFSTFGNTNIVTLEGRALSLGASVTLVDTIINVPAP